MGAMRFPPSHTILHGVVKALKLPLTPFTRLSQTDGSYFFLNGKYYKAHSLGAYRADTGANNGSEAKLRPKLDPQLNRIVAREPMSSQSVGSRESYLTQPRVDEKKLTEIYSLFNITVTDSLRSGNGSHAPLLNPFALLDDIFEEKLNLKEGLQGRNFCKDDQTLRDFLRDAVANRSLPEELIHFWGSLDLIKPFYDHSFIEWVSDSNQMQSKNNPEKEHKIYMELVNGSSSLTNELLRMVKGFGTCTLKLHSQVVGVDQTLKDKPIKVKYIDVSNDVMGNPQISTKHKTMSADRVIMTPPATALLSIELSPAVPYAKYLALNSLNYFGSVKVVLAFSEAFWAKKNKAPTMRLVNSWLNYSHSYSLGTPQWVRASVGALASQTTC
jgi:hypothetical protein